MQIYEEKSAEFVDFARGMGGFESKEVPDWENYNDDKSIILIIHVTPKRKRKILAVGYKLLPTQRGVTFCTTPLVSIHLLLLFFHTL